MTKAKYPGVFHDPYNYLGAQPEENDGKSVVLPDQSFTIAELFERSKAGMPVGGDPGFYTPDVKLGDLDVSKLEGMDIVDQKIALRAFVDRVQRYQAQLDDLYLKDQEASKAKQMAEFTAAMAAAGKAPDPGKGAQVLS